eukprot:419367-Rhodomonas_salina.1
MKHRREYSPRNVAIVALGSIVMASLPRVAVGWCCGVPVARFCGSQIGAAVSHQHRFHSTGTVHSEFVAAGAGLWLPLRRNRILDLAFESSRGKKTAGALDVKAQRLVPEQEVEAEIKVKNSRFIGSVAHTPTVEAARLK